MRPLGRIETNRKRGVVGQTALKLLLLVLADRKPPTIRKLSDTVDININAIRRHLGILRETGLLSFEDATHHTIRPCVRFIPADRLAEEGKS